MADMMDGKMALQLVTRLTSLAPVPLQDHAQGQQAIAVLNAGLANLAALKEQLKGLPQLENDLKSTKAQIVKFRQEKKDKKRLKKNK